MQLESGTIRFVSKSTTVPTPEIIFSWIDTAWNQSFLILKAIRGKILDRAWASLSDEQQMQVADVVAGLCNPLTSFTSDKLTTAEGKGVLEPFLTVAPPQWEPW